jgi:ADP-heptose:LPS heptosyltransferase
MRQLILQTPLSPGDVLMLTAAVRDLHRCHPGEFVTDVRTNFPELWTHHPGVTRLDAKAPGVELIDCHYPAIDRAGWSPRHFLEGYLDFLNGLLGTRAVPTAFRGEVPLSAAERAQPSWVADLLGADVPYWILDAGGKFDFTIKWWSDERWQAVVDRLRGRVLFVQIGHAQHFHPRLDGVLDLRGLTTTRQLVHLMHHAEGVLCPVTFPMHLAAAVDRPAGRTGVRPCVVVAGGREPVHWFAYPGHQVLQRVGTLPCCATTGCWKARTFALGDGTDFDRPGALCVDVTGALPRCMASISVDEVVRSVEHYLEGGQSRTLSAEDRRWAERAPEVSVGTAYGWRPLNRLTARHAFEAAAVRPWPELEPGVGRGIVMLACGENYAASAWIALRRLRASGCQLPVELWHWGEHDWRPEYDGWFAGLGARIESFHDWIQRHPTPLTHPWALKPYAMVHSRFEEILYLDADQVVLRDPTYLFEEPEYRRTGAVFWPDERRWDVGHPMWILSGVPYADEPEVQAGEALLDRRRLGRALRLTLWMNEQHEYFYRYMIGDKDTYRLAFRKLGQPYAMPPYPVQVMDGTFIQRDFQGVQLWQHRIRPKWQVAGPNPRVEGFRWTEECEASLEEWRRLRAGNRAGAV